MSLSMEPGRSRSWVLDKNKVRQLLYHLIVSVIQTANTGSVVRIHVSHKSDGLNIAVGVSHAWLGDGLTQVNSKGGQLSVPIISNYPEAALYNKPEPPSLPVSDAQPLDSSSDSLAAPASPALELADLNSCHRSRESLRLLLSYHLAQMHGGQISIQGTPESGYRYVVSLPELKAVEENL